MSIFGCICLPNTQVFFGSNVWSHLPNASVLYFEFSSSLRRQITFSLLATEPSEIQQEETRDRLEPLPTRKSPVASPHERALKSPADKSGQLQQTAFSAHIYRKAIRSLNSKHRQIQSNQEIIISTHPSRSSSSMSNATHQSAHFNDSSVTSKKRQDTAGVFDSCQKNGILDKPVVYHESVNANKRNSNLQKQKDALMGLKVSFAEMLGFYNLKKNVKVKIC